MPKFTPAAVDRVFRRQVSSARELIPEIVLDRLERLIRLELSGFLGGV